MHLGHTPIARSPVRNRWLQRPAFVYRRSIAASFYKCFGLPVGSGTPAGHNHEAAAPQCQVSKRRKISKLGFQNGILTQTGNKSPSSGPHAVRRAMSMIYDNDCLTDTIPKRTKAAPKTASSFSLRRAFMRLFGLVS